MTLRVCVCHREWWTNIGTCTGKSSLTLCVCLFACVHEFRGWSDSTHITGRSPLTSTPTSTRTNTNTCYHTHTYNGNMFAQARHNALDAEILYLNMLKIIYEAPKKMTADSSPPYCMGCKIQLRCIYSESIFYCNNLSIHLIKSNRFKSNRFSIRIAFRYNRFE